MRWVMLSAEVPCAGVLYAGVLCAGFLCAGAAAAADPVAEGRAVAERWCAACHAVPGLAATDTAASFSAIARRDAMTPAALAVAIADPHPRMPDPGLTRDQLDAVVAFIESLRP